MGVINVTPDSFSDGGRYLDPGAAVEAAERLASDGADLLDLGAESTRPGATAVSSDVEWGRLAPILTRLGKTPLGARLSIDTRKPDLMLRAADLGVGVINDVAGGAPVPTLERLANYGNLQYIAMHMQGTPESMQKDPLQGAAAVHTVDRFFGEAHARLRAAGFADGRIWLDPGIGFGKGDSGNIRLLDASREWTKRFQLCVGVSRKSFIGRALGLPRPEDRDAPSKMLELGLAMAGVQMIRTHDVAGLRRLANLLEEPLREDG